MKNLSMHNYVNYGILALFCFVLFFNFACEEDDHDHDDEHTDADGFVLESDTGAEVYREFEGESTGSITLGVGDTLELSVHFLDHDGEEIEHEEEEHEDEISVSGYDSNIAIVASEEHEEEEDHDHEEEHGMAIHVIGVGSGSTSFKLELMHEEHADYTSTNNIPIVVN